MNREEFEAYIGQKVEVFANQIIYAGVLEGTSETGVSLQTPMHWIELSYDQIFWIRRSEG
jgi:hypothetical protein